MQVASDGKEEQQPLASPEDPNVHEFHITGARGAEARAIITAEGVVVLEGSYAAADEVESTPDSTRRLRAKLVEERASLLPTPTCVWFQSGIAIRLCPERKRRSHQSHGTEHSSS